MPSSLKIPLTGDALHVAVGVVGNGCGEILIAQRHARAHQGGLWEFPGGKVEAGESVEEALRRELAEELGIRVLAAVPLIKVRHHYGDREVLLDVWRVTDYEGTPAGAEGQAVTWVEREKMEKYRFPAANVPILRAILLPQTYAILDLESAGGEEATLLRNLEVMLGRGVALVQFRAKTLERASCLKLAREVIARCESRGVKVLLNAEPKSAAAANAAGVHLTARRLMALQARPQGAGSLVAASCHGRGEIEQAQRLGVDFAVLGPVKRTATHPQAAALGWERFESLVSTVNIPVFALGGLTGDDLPEALLRGAQGVAGIRMFSR